MFYLWLQTKKLTNNVKVFQLFFSSLLLCCFQETLIPAIKFKKVLIKQIFCSFVGSDHSYCTHSIFIEMRKSSLKQLFVCFPILEILKQCLHDFHVKRVNLVELFLLGRFHIFLPLYLFSILMVIQVNSSFLGIKILLTMIPFQKQPLNFKQRTEKALRTINEHEKIKQMRFATMLNIQSENTLIHSVQATKTFQPRQKIKLQLLPHSLVYFKMELNNKIDPKIIIRYFKGGPAQIFIFFDKIMRELDKAKYHFIIKDEIILKWPAKYVQEAKFICIAFRSNSNMSNLQFRIDEVRQKKKTLEVKTEKSIASVDLQELSIGQIKLKRSKSSKGKLLKIVNSQELISSRPEQKLKRILQLKIASQDKKNAAVKRIQNIQINKEKSVEALKVANSCKKMFGVYQDLVSEENERKLVLLKLNTPLIYAIKYCFISSMFFDERQKNMRRILTIRSFEKKFIKRIRRAYRLTKQMQPQQSIRELQPFKQLTSLFGHTLRSMSMKKSVDIVEETFNKCLPGFLINLAMNQSSNYRRIVRGIQRRWKSRFQARNTMLLFYAEQQLKIILKTYPHLQYVQKQYREGNQAYRICLEYQKDTANKMKDLISAYHHKLQQIEEYEEINRQIKNHNSCALKKNQKQLLEIPKKRAFPQFRFFRDLLFMKSLIRGELQVLFRKFKKKNPQLFQQGADGSPIKIKNKIK